MEKLLHNYHTHTIHCGHSSNKMEDLIQTAISEGYQTLGISEHCPLLLEESERKPSPSQLPFVIEEFKTLKAKYKDRIDLHFGLETEYYKNWDSFFRKFLDNKDIEYLVFGNHDVTDRIFNEDWSGYYKSFLFNKSSKYIDIYLKNTKDAFESNLFSVFAHPDIFLYSYQKWDDDSLRVTKAIINLSIKHDVPLGFNGNGFRVKEGLSGTEKVFAYPCEHFWKEVSKSKAKVIIETDAHDLKGMKQDMVKPLIEFALKLGLKDNLIEKLNFKEK